jgi:protein gp37
MGRTTKIQWAESTWNPWRGCTMVSPGCANCYAARLAPRNPAVLGVWGPQGTRVVAAESGWRQPLSWNHRASAEYGNERGSIFPSLCDVFEDWPGPMLSTQEKQLWRTPNGDWQDTEQGSDGPLTMNDVRARLWDLIARTPHLDWLLLTKRPENIGRMMPSGDWPNVWLGVSIESQQYAWRADALLDAPQRGVPVRFVSYEPALGLLDLTPCLHHGGINWVIVGGESDPGARPFWLDWADAMLGQCYRARVPFFLKQLGSNPMSFYQHGFDIMAQGASASSHKGDDMDYWPQRLQVRQMPPPPG